MKVIIRCGRNGYYFKKQERGLTSSRKKAHRYDLSDPYVYECSVTPKKHLILVTEPTE